MQKTSILLINLGTPDGCDAASVRRYLKEFLNDPRVIDLPALVRFVLTNFIILPFRYKKSAQAYQKIWRQEGSPLLHYSEKMRDELALALGDAFQVEIGMRYGKPSIASALKKFASMESLIVLPLFPQYASASTGSALAQLLSLLAKEWNIPQVKIIHHFYNHPTFISAVSMLIKQHLAAQPVDKIIFSYHGLPSRHIHKSLCQVGCSDQEACPLMSVNNAYCYRAQCYATTRLVAAQLQLKEDQYAVSFQSRLGRTPWIKPYTDELLLALRKQGIKNIAIVCPSFVADCLETLEEINIRARGQWLSLGGENFIFIPCVNYSPEWIQALVEMVHKV